MKSASSTAIPRRCWNAQLHRLAIGNGRVFLPGVLGGMATGTGDPQPQLTASKRLAISQTKARSAENGKRQAGRLNIEQSLQFVEARINCVAAGDALLGASRRR